MKAITNIILAAALSVASGLGHAGAVDDMERNIREIARKELLRVFGDARGNFYVPNALYAETVWQFLTIHSNLEETVQELDKNIYFLPGCRPHSCHEKAAVVVDVKEERLLAVAIRHFNCRPDPVEQKRTTCDNFPTLNIFLPTDADHPNAEALRKKYEPVMRAWGKKWGYNHGILTSWFKP